MILRQISYFFSSITILCAGCTAPRYTEVDIRADERGAYVPVTIGDTTVHMLWDTGCTATTLSDELADRLGIKEDIAGSNHVVFIPGIDDFTPQRKRIDIGKRLFVQVGGIRKPINPWIDTDNENILGADVLNEFYYAMCLTDRLLKLSDRPISFADRTIVDSLTFPLEESLTTMRTRRKIESDTLCLVFDSGMSLPVRFGDNPKADIDLMLVRKDSGSSGAKVHADLLERAKYYFTFGDGDDECTVVYDSVFDLGGLRPIKAYVGCLNAGASADIVHGFITYGLIARYDVFYFDPRLRVVKLYRMENSDSMLHDVSFWDVVRGAPTDCTAKQHDTSVLEFGYDAYGRIVIPVKMGDKTDLWMWDSGASISLGTVAHEELAADSVSIRVGASKREERRAVGREQEIAIGDMRVRCHLVENEENVVGGNVISSFYWYFDFTIGKCTVSRDPITASMPIKLVLPFENLAGTPLCTVSVDTLPALRLGFDTGHSGGVIAGCNSDESAILRSDVWMDPRSEAIDRTVVRLPGTTPIRLPQGVSGWVINGAKINGLPLTLFLRSGDRYEYCDGLFTVDFAKRFDAMYYDPFDRKITLYAGSDRRSELLGSAIYHFLETVAGEEYPFKTPIPPPFI